MNYPAIQANTAKMIASYGFAMTLTRAGVGTFDPVSSTTTGATPQTWNVFGMKGNLGKLSRYSEFGLIIGSDIRKGDVLVLLEAGVVVPLPGDVLTMQGEDWTVLASDGLDPGGLDLLYNMWVRK